MIIWPCALVAPGAYPKEVLFTSEMTRIQEEARPRCNLQGVTSLVTTSF